MKKIKILIELEYDDELMHNGENDQEAKDWFYNDILMRDYKALISTEIGDEVGNVRVLKIIEPEQSCAICGYAGKDFLLNLKDNISMCPNCIAEDL